MTLVILHIIIKQQLEIKQYKNMIKTCEHKNHEVEIIESDPIDPRDCTYESECVFCKDCGENISLEYFSIYEKYDEQNPILLIRQTK